ncbi:MAG: AAA family ATPase [Candidatus Rokubacteria bacterium]|nr:AAA family ATPase [Candidatus Rokubacteria bacterium]
MYEAYWGLNAAPFQNVPDPKFFCPLPACQDVLEKLLYVVRHGKGGAILTGEVGCGKSTLSRVFLLQLEEDKYDIGLVINPSVPSEELLHEIALQLGVSPSGPQRSALFHAVTDHMLENARAGKSTVLIIDEAHTIRDEAVFEDLRMLLNFQLNDRQMLTLILLGAPELRDVMARHGSLQQRLPIRLNLSPLSEGEAAAYIEFRLEKAGATRPIFTAEAVKAIAGATGGIPRRINTLCDLCLFEGWKKRAKAVDTTIVRLAQSSL